MLTESCRTKRMRKFCVRTLDLDVFGRLEFQSDAERDIFYDSYVQNIDALIEYAITNKLNVGKYFRNIKTILLESQNVQRRSR